LVEINCFSWTGYYSIVARRPIGYNNNRVTKIYINKVDGKFDVYLKVVGNASTLVVRSDYSLTTNSSTTTEPSSVATLDLSG
jgi:hypothetical protein